MRAAAEHDLILDIQSRECGRRLGPGDGRGQLGGQASYAGVGQPHEPRPEKRRGPEIRRRLRQKSQQRDRVLNLGRVEEAEPLVDVGRNAATLERRLELAMAFPRSEQDADVGGLGRTPDAGLPIPNRRGRQQPDDLLGGRFGCLAYGLGGNEPERDVLVGYAVSRVQAEGVDRRFRRIAVRVFRRSFREIDPARRT